jgi:hypothetical protein
MLGVRSILNRSPQSVIDERLLGIELGVQEVAAKQYLKELMAVGILNEDKKATSLALQWRLEEKYPAAVEQLIAKTYLQGLRDLAPASDGDRQKAISWFKHEGLGEGAARNKAATYFMIGSPVPNESPSKTASDSSSSPKTSRAKRAVKSTGGSQEQVERTRSKTGGYSGRDLTDNIPLNVNVQIHISADAGSDQIEAIFSAMRRYLYEKQTN